mgnify:CR=1 FL=1
MAEYQKQVSTDRQGNPVYMSVWKKRKAGRTGSGGKSSRPLKSGSASMFPMMDKLMIRKNRKG